MPAMKDINLKLEYNEVKQHNTSSTVHSPNSHKASPTHLDQKIEKIEKIDPSKPIREHIACIVDFILNNIGRIDESRLSLEESKYSFNPSLKQLFRALVNKYSGIVKTKEEMIKCVIRRAFKQMKNKIKESNGIDARSACKLICEKYFGISKEEFEKQALSHKDEEELLDDLLPFRKNSKNRTMNNSFLNQVFGSEEFKNDFDQFLQDLQESMFSDNERKAEKFVETLENLMRKNKIDDVQGIKRIPWLTLWIEKTKSVAIDMKRNGE